MSSSLSSYLLSMLPLRKTVCTTNFITVAVIFASFTIIMFFLTLFGIDSSVPYGKTWNDVCPSGCGSWSGLPSLSRSKCRRYPGEAHALPVVGLAALAKICNRGMEAA